LLALGQVIDLYDGAVYVEIDAVTLLKPRGAVLVDLCQVGHGAHMRANGEPK
jgi:hypothetical protein